MLAAVGLLDGLVRQLLLDERELYGLPEPPEAKDCTCTTRGPVWKGAEMKPTHSWQLIHEK